MTSWSVPEWLSPLADVFSLIAFLMTVWVLIVTRALKRSFELKVRTPELRRSLAQSAKLLPALIKSWPQSRSDSLGVFANIRAVLENLLKKLPRGERTEVKRLVRDLRGKKIGLFQYIPIAQYEAEDLWTIFAEMQAVITSLEQRQKDATWK